MDLQVLERVIAILREQEDGSVTQRFQIAILQKMSAQNTTQLDEGVTESVIELMVKKQMMQWCLDLLQRAKKPDLATVGTLQERMSSIHPFCLDFASALLANLLHASSTM